ncbi:GDSL-type esterase/lipase family protein [Dactylosporangium cerinum]|uniref:GDSL-type esterase/lipase family protein n=1 Tax=Dactylosporangium cerinum TaxID=1434730 RepID=A0ABV9W333_9ACTN
MQPSVHRFGSILRTLWVAVALTVMLIYASDGASSLTTQVLFTVFIAVAAIWLRGQYADSLDGRQWVIPYWFGGCLLAAAAVLVALYKVLDIGALGMAGLLVAYFVAGSVVAQIRQSDSVHLIWLPNDRRRLEVRPMRWGLQLTIAGVVLAFGGAVVLWATGRLGLSLALIVLGVLVVLPLGLSIWSERVISWLQRMDDARVWLWSLAGAGALVFGGVTFLAVTLSHSRWLIVVMVVLGLLIVALVSSTQADLVAVMAVVALMGVTPLQAKEHGQLDPSGDHDVLVALGDSYMSGEGAAIYFEGTDDGGGNQCRRSPTAWAAMAARDERNFDGLMFLACSGARTANVLTEKPTVPSADATLTRVGVPEPEPMVGEAHTQLDAYNAVRGRFTPKLVVLSIGGNDAGFSTIGEMCLAPANCNKMSYLWMQSLDQVRKQLRATYLEVDAAFPGVPVLIVPYPDPISTEANGCTQVVLSHAEQEFVHLFLTEGLNAVIRQTAEEFGFHYLAPMQDALAKAHLQLCDPLNDGRPGINFIGLRSVRGIAEQRFNPANWIHSSLHPNERGHAAMQQVFQTWLASDKDALKPRLEIPGTADTRKDDALADQRDTTEDAAQQMATDEAPPCNLFDDTNGCRPKGKDWAFRQIGHTLVITGWFVLLIAAGAWCMAIALFAWRRRRWA